MTRLSRYYEGSGQLQSHKGPLEPGVTLITARINNGSVSCVYRGTLAVSGQRTEMSQRCSRETGSHHFLIPEEL
ncbi:uncharacterized [Tachysurus ichikawai]